MDFVHTHGCVFCVVDLFLEIFARRGIRKNSFLSPILSESKAKRTVTEIPTPMRVSTKYMYVFLINHVFSFISFYCFYFIVLVFFSFLYFLFALYLHFFIFVFWDKYINLHFLNICPIFRIHGHSFSKQEHFLETMNIFSRCMAIIQLQENLAFYIFITRTLFFVKVNILFET